jgi:hypothetical protein
VKGDGYRHSADGEHRVPVIAVERLEENDFVSWVEEGQAGRVESAGGACGDENLRGGVSLDAVVGGELGGDGFA